MSMNMIGVAFNSSSYGSYEDAKARVKHQGLLQDYQELQKETEAAKNKLENRKLRRLTLLAEVRFLRRRCKYLRENKPLKPPQLELAQSPFMETYLQKNNRKERPQSKKEATLRNLPPIFNLNQKGRVYMEKIAPVPNIVPVSNLKQKKTSKIVKEASLKNSTPASDQNHKRKANRGKEVAPRKLMPVIDLNKKVRTNNSTALRNSAQTFNLGHKGNSLSGKEAAVGTQAPVFDLNQISREEEEYQENSEPRNALVRDGLEEHQQNDMMLSVCRNIGEASTSRPGKRKISWQDPVTLRV